jgi:hypothetical protein
MAREVLILNNPKLTIAATQAGLDAGDPFECQITSAVATPTPVYATVPATGCAPASQSPGRTGWGWVVAWLQDWGRDPSMSQYAFDNDATAVWLRFTADPTQFPDFIVEDHVYLAAGQIGGTFGDGSAAPANATWPSLDKPAFPVVTP